MFADQGDSDGESPLLRYMCQRCIGAFDPRHDFCPHCNGPRPSEGWRKTRDFPDVWLGRLIQRDYRLFQRIGKGTFGAVYRARRPHLEGSYAVKIIDLDGSRFGGNDGPSLRNRVEREVRILSSISSPHIVSFHDFIDLHGGSVGVVMDYVDGRTLGQLLAEEGDLKVDRAVQFAIEIASGLGEAHRRGVVHRDLKPDNVMIQSLGRRGEFVKLIDFGVARVQDEVSRTVGFVGTPRYTSPEQARGNNVDNTSDVYNLGILLFHMVTGDPPFTQDDVNELLAAHSDEKTPRISASVQGKTIPPELDSLVRSMTAKSPENRPEDMQVVTESLKRVKHEIEDSKQRAGSSGRDKTGDSHPPRFDTDMQHGFGAAQDTGDFDSVDQRSKTVASDGAEGVFEKRPPSGVFDVVSRERIIFCDEDDQIRIQDNSSGELEERVLASLSHPVTSIAGGHADWLLVGQQNGRVTRIDLDTGDLSTILHEPELGAVDGLAVTRNRAQIVAGFDSGEAMLGIRQGSNFEWDHLPSGAPVVSVGIHRDGSCIAVSRDNRQTDVFIPSRSTDAPSAVIEHDEDPDNVDFSPDGYLVAVRLEDGRVKLFSALTGAHVSDAPNSVLQPSSVFEEK